jgi:parvulin-like peptidyl-prolyl isomerase
MDVVKGVLLENFMNDQGIKSETELRGMLAQQGASLEQLEERLVAMFVPEEVIRFEVVGRESVGEREVEAYYHEHIKDYEIPAEVTLREIVLVAENEAEKTGRRTEIEEIRARVTAADVQFADVATEVSEAPSAANGGLIGPLHQGDLAKALDEVAFSLPVGEVSEIIETERTYHLISVVTRRQADFTPFEDVREELRTTLEEMRYDEAYEDFMIKARAEAEIVVTPKYAEKYDWGDTSLLQN